MLYEIECHECGTFNTLRYLSASLVDPGCWAEEPECSNCGAQLQTDEAEPMTEEEMRWANHPDV